MKKGKVKKFLKRMAVVVKESNPNTPVLIIPPYTRNTKVSRYVAQNVSK